MQYPKSVREALCLAQSTLAEHARRGMDVDRVPGYIVELQHMIDEIDYTRPLGSDGKHGKLHTLRCGCEGHTSAWFIRFEPEVN